ncbi:unnamed protein product [Polarella glacialis]|uniref:Poly [ADP-ribose] polymerase n=1 Tax=Polarella glacialis TaxID=89957 RepID=A0A813J884_POLGL|nr:unnamed protein product [Polarella glacialis]CAE8669116.1 unnamed protein product [Polarella glacialis]
MEDQSSLFWVVFIATGVTVVTTGICLCVLFVCWSGCSACLPDELDLRECINFLRRKRSRVGAEEAKRTVPVCLGRHGSAILQDSNGDGQVDTIVEYVPRKSPQGKPSPKKSSPKGLPPFAVDTTGDGQADSVLIDSKSAGLYDTVVSKDRAELSFLAAQAASPGRAKSPGRGQKGFLLEAELATPRGTESFPSYWKTSSVPVGTADFMKIAETKYVFDSVKALLQGTFEKISTRDRRTKMPDALEPVKIWRVENAPVWQRYASHRSEMSLATSLFDTPPRTFRLLAKPMQNALQDGVTEHYLFHGTSPSGAVGITDQGFDVQRAGENAGSLYGPGLYFAEKSSKSDEYASEDKSGEYAGHCAMLLCRVVLGKVLHWQTEAGYKLQREWARGCYDSILGDREAFKGTYREFVLPPEEAEGDYPEYIIIYKRIINLVT